MQHADSSCYSCGERDNKGHGFSNMYIVTGSDVEWRTRDNQRATIMKVDEPDDEGKVVLSPDSLRNGGIRVLYASVASPSLTERCAIFGYRCMDGREGCDQAHSYHAPADLKFLTSMFDASLRNSQ